MNSKRKIRVGHSPDADDAFMFYALAQGKIPLNGFEIEHVIEDIESLNQRAFRAQLEVTALSCHAFGYLSDRYRLLPYGASVGEGYGPVLVRRSPVIARPRVSSHCEAAFQTLPKQSTGSEIASATSWPRNDEPGDCFVAPPPSNVAGRLLAKTAAPARNIRGSRIAVPGKYTTAYLVLQLYEKNFEPVFTSFDQIFAVVEKGKADFGLVIHEGQLTFEEKGFRKVIDLGEWWRERYRLPLPLGINAIRKDLGEAAILGFSRVFLKSLEYAMTHREEAMRYALEFGRGIDAKRGNRFVGMYVNKYSLSLGERGKRALGELFRLGWEKGLLPRPVELGLSDL